MRTKRDIISRIITWHLGLVGSNNFGEYTSFSPFTLGVASTARPHNDREYVAPDVLHD